MFRRPVYDERLSPRQEDLVEILIKFHEARNGSPEQKELGKTFLHTADEYFPGHVTIIHNLRRTFE